MASLAARLGLLITAVGADIKTLTTKTAQITAPSTTATTVSGTLSVQAPSSGPLMQTAYVVIAHTASTPPTGTPANTLVIKQRT